MAKGHLIRVDPLPSLVEYGWMTAFAVSVPDHRLRALLDIALAGRGAFRRFKRVLGDHRG